MYSEYCFIGEYLHHRGDPNQKWGDETKCDLRQVNAYLRRVIGNIQSAVPGIE